MDVYEHKHRFQLVLHRILYHFDYVMMQQILKDDENLHHVDNEHDEK